MKTSIDYKILIVGGGASGLFLANALFNKGFPLSDILLIERGDRLGRKLSATGNGQGNITNLSVRKGGYFSATAAGVSRAQAIVENFNQNTLAGFFEGLGVPLVADERGRIYPASKQASALTDALRLRLQKLPVRFNEKVVDIQKQNNIFTVKSVTSEGEKTYRAEKVILCAGGKAAKNFGTDGNAYALAQNLGHTLTPLFPSLVQLKTDTAHIKNLKGIRVNDGQITVEGQPNLSMRGDIIFTDYGISGDAVFRLSAYIADGLTAGVPLLIDFLPKITVEEVAKLLLQKQTAYPALPKEELLFGIVNNQIGRAIFRRANGNIQKASALVKAFPITATGSLGFDYAQVTKGGISLAEVDGDLQSKLVENLYFTGEILDIDGVCGGYNLQWAFSSANQVAKSILPKERGQVCK